MEDIKEDITEKTDGETSGEQTADLPAEISAAAAEEEKTTSEAIASEEAALAEEATPTEESAPETATSEESTPSTIKTSPLSVRYLVGCAAGLLLIAAAVIMLLISLRIWRETQAGDTVYADKTWYEQYVPEKVELELPGTEETAASGQGTALPVTGSAVKEFAATGLIAAEDDAFFYIADPSEGGHVYSVSKKDRSRKLLAGLPADEICLSAGRLYIVCRSGAGDKLPGLYACGTDGSMQEFILEGGVRSMKAAGGMLYYIRCRDGRICSYDCAGGTERILSDKECVNMVINGEMIYYIARDDDRAEGSDRVICRMDTEGGSRMNLTVHGAYGDIGYMDEKIVYVNYEEGYGYIDPDTDITLPASDLEKSFVKIQGLYSLPAAADGCLWYIDRSRDRQLIKADMESGSEELLNVYGVDSVYLMKDCFIISWMENGTELCIASFMKDGYVPAALFEGELR